MFKYLLLPLLLLSLQLTTQAQCLNGIYTIGGTSPNYTFVSDAVKALYNGGVCGPVVFNIRPGTYTDTLFFRDSIPGSSSINTVSFQSGTGQNKDVVLDAGKFKSSVLIDKGSNIIFKNLTFKNTSPTESYNVRSLQYTKASNLQFINCVFKAVTCNASILGDDSVLVFSNCLFDSFDSNIGIEGDHATNVTITACMFTARGTPVTCRGQEIDFSNNSFRNCVKMLHFYNSKNVKIEHNVADSIGGSGISAPIFLGGVENFSFQYNMISTRSLGNWRGKDLIQLYDCNSGTDRFMNNLVNQRMDGGYQHIILVNGSSYILFYHNTIRCNTSDTTSSIIDFNGGHYNMLKNNILTNEGQGSCFSFYGSTYTISDHNNLFTKKGKYLVTTTGPNYPDLHSWQKAEGSDLHSTSFDPFLLSPTDSHSPNILLKYSGANIGNALPVDLDSISRDTIQPDPGAYVITPFVLDAGIQAINSTITLCEGIAPVTVNLINYGSTVLKKLNINWKIDGVSQPTYKWSGTLTPGSETLVTIGNTTYQKNNFYAINIWTDQPNGSNDNFIRNDSSSIFNTTTSLNGLYTIGGTNPDYTTIQAVIKDLASRGVCGPVTFALRDGVYTGTYDFKKVRGASSINTITFQSEKKDSATVSLKMEPFNILPFDPHLIAFKESGYFIFSDLTFLSTSDVKNTVKIEAGSSFITFTNCHFKNPPSYAIINCEGAHHLNFTNNFFDGSNTPILIGIFSDKPWSDIIINNNTFENYYTSPVLSRYGTNISIVQNKFLGSRDAHTYEPAINLYGHSGAIKIDKNLISGKSSGISLDNCSGDSLNPSSLTNNMINADGIYGFFIHATSHIHLFHNTVNVRSSIDTSIVLYIRGCMDLINLNNIYSNLGNGYCYSADRNEGISDNNNFFSANSKFIKWSGFDLKTLADLQIRSGKNRNSISVNPTYVSITDLHIENYNPFLNGSGSNSTGVFLDFDSDIRKTRPDIGADEYNFIAEVDDHADDIVFTIGPNPFSLQTFIHYSLVSPASVKLEVYNNLGQQVHTLVQQEQQIGDYHVSFDPTAIGLNAGVYFIKLSYNDSVIALPVVKMN